MMCQQCGAQMREDDLYCGACGAKAERAQASCSHCGGAVGRDDVFCMHCGARLAEEPEPSAGETADLSGLDHYVTASDATASMSAISSDTVRAYQAPGSSQKSGPNPFAIALVIGVVMIVLAVAVAVVVIVGGLGGQQQSSQLMSSSSTSSTEDTATLPSSNNAAQTGSASSVPSGGFVLPDSSTRYYARAELEPLSDWDLYIARNEIYARHGRGFKNEDLRSYFASCSWYVERYTPEAFEAMPSPLNDVEKKNADLMLAIETERNSPYLKTTQ